MRLYQYTTNNNIFAHFHSAFNYYTDNSYKSGKYLKLVYFITIIIIYVQTHEQFTHVPNENYSSYSWNFECMVKIIQVSIVKTILVHIIYNFTYRFILGCWVVIYIIYNIVY